MSQDKQPSPSYRDEWLLTRYFVSVLEQKLAGREAQRKTNVHPLDWCHLGVLGPAKQAHAPVQLDATTIEGDWEAVETPAGEAVAGAAKSTAKAQADAPAGDKAAAVASAEGHDGVAANPDKGDDREGLRRPPSAIGFEVLLEPAADGVIEFLIDASFCIFTKHIPTYAEQMTAASGAPLVDVVRRWPLQQDGIRIRLQTKESDIAADADLIQGRLDQTLATAFSAPDAERIWGTSTRPKVTAPHGDSETQFNAFVANIVGGTQVETWQLKGCVELRATPRPDGKVRVGCYFRNLTPETPPLTKGKGLKDAFKVISDVQLNAVVTQGVLHPIEILPVPQDYQYDRRVWAVGHNTSVRVAVAQATIATAALAMYEQPRITTRDIVPAKFSALVDQPFQTLAQIYQAMEAYEKDWRERVLDGNALHLDPDALEECRKDHAGFCDEIRRFACGVAALKSDDRLLKAFVSANRVFGRLAVGYDAWRLFQLVFIVTQLPALAIRENRSSGEFPTGVVREWKDVLDWGDVLWFRTGGGKTEAYLGLACCAMLYDRLRNKHFGLTAWLRFPLRMLSIQQLQRAMRVVWETEKERLAILGDEAKKKSTPFRLGYFVGSTTTPNSLSQEDLKKYSSEEALERLRVIPDCPECGGRGTVKVKPDAAAIRFRHTCEKCSSELPLDISDDEVYRSLPTLVVGTIDKMASVGQQRKFGMLWGGVKWRCPVHGYAFGEKCFAYPCDIDKKRQRLPQKPYDAAPAFHIQDELHLLQEELGAFSGHYETLIRHCEATVGGMPSKIVAATATIEGFENQVRHLYGVREARRFPGRGYDKLRSFYAEPALDDEGRPKIARIFVAFRSPSLPPADASAICSEILHEEIGNLFKNPHVALAFLRDAQNADDVVALLRYYTTTLNYVGSLAKGSRVRQQLDDAATRVRPGARDLNVEYHSSRSTSAQVADVVHRIESPPAWDDNRFLDALVATNMISHGVDLERFNLMTMDGVPDQTAEYIQASSRSGRKHVGLVVVVLAGFSLRATSIYHRFLEYHAHLDRMVTPVPVNRFAKYAAQRTVPGLSIGLVYGLYAAQNGQATLYKRSEVAALLTRPDSDFLANLHKAYSLGAKIYDERLEKSLIEALNHQFGTVELSIRNNNDQNVIDAVRPKPMMSLRDVEIGVPFWAEHGDTRLFQFAQKVQE